MSQNLGDRHPDIIEIRSAIEDAERRLQVEVDKVVISVQNEYRTAVAQEVGLLAALEAQKEQSLELDRKAIDYRVLRRDVESNRQIYESLLQRSNETGVTENLGTSNIRIIDEAEVPRSPISPRRAANLLLGFLVGGLFGVGLAFGFEYLDNRIRHPEEIKTHLGVAFLGCVPRAAGLERNEAALITDDVPPAFLEAIRSVRTNLLFSSAEEGTRSILVSRHRAW